MRAAVTQVESIYSLRVVAITMSELQRARQQKSAFSAFYLLGGSVYRRFCLPPQPLALTTAIEKQREQLFQVQAIAGALGVALQESYDTLALEHVTRVIVNMLDDTIEALEPRRAVREIR